jgi:hypothetical protein
MVMALRLLFLSSFLKDLEVDFSKHVGWFYKLSFPETAIQFPLFDRNIELVDEWIALQQFSVAPVIIIPTKFSHSMVLMWFILILWSMHSQHQIVINQVKNPIFIGVLRNRNKPALEVRFLAEKFDFY